MLLSHIYQIDKVAADPETEEMRPMLCNVLIERIDETRGIAIAANGFALAVVPVTLSEEDVPGLVPVDVVHRAHVLEAERIGLFNQDAPITWIDRPTGTYPEWRRLLRDRPKTTQTNQRVFIFNPWLLGQVALALGCAEYQDELEGWQVGPYGKQVDDGRGRYVGVQLTRTTDTGPILIEIPYSSEIEVIKDVCAPFGLLMPHRTNERQGGTRNPSAKEAAAWAGEEPLATKGA